MTMKYVTLCWFYFTLCILSSLNSCKGDGLSFGLPPGPVVVDWLVDPISAQAEIDFIGVHGPITMRNGLISRKFVTVPDFTTVDIRDLHSTNSSILRAFAPEATLIIDDIRYTVGGLNVTDPDCLAAYLNLTACLNGAEPLNGFTYSGMYIASETEAPFPYSPARGAPADIKWPPPGQRIDFIFNPPKWAPALHQKIKVTVRYEIYSGLPLMAKWLIISSADEVKLSFEYLEMLRLNQPWRQQIFTSSRLGDQNVGPFYIETDQAHGTKIIWSDDNTETLEPGSFEPLVKATYVDPFTVYLKGSFETARVHELIIGPADLERATLARRRMFRFLAPHTQENPIFFHMTLTDTLSVRHVIDQMADVGFEMMIYSFWSGIDIENDDPSYIKSVADQVAYAKSRGIEVGAYDLIALSRGVKSEWMAMGADNKTVGSACMASGWFDYLSQKIDTFYKQTGMTMIETDGPYGGYSCHSTSHAHHRDYSDSVSTQMRAQQNMYLKFRKRTWYINQPDNFFYQGGSKTGMGYDESQYSLPRWQDLAISRQAVYMDTFFHIPSVGWMFVPLVDYHGGGDAAAFEPLYKHTAEYNFAFGQYMGAGVAACYRGYRLYDNSTTRQIVKKWVDFYKNYRDILNSDIIHVKYPNQQEIDIIIHVNPKLQNKALAVLFNPTAKEITSTVYLPLYYAGIKSNCLYAQEPGTLWHKAQLDSWYRVSLTVTLASKDVTWFILRNND